VTLTRASSLPDFKQAVEGRIQALGRAHSMLAASRWEGADLHRIAAEELAPYAGAGAARIHLEGPAIVLKPAAAQSIALVIHELATNALKYGALSTETGALDIRWDVSSDGLILKWTESGGPPVAPRTNQSRSGFGTRLIHSSIERQLGGTLGLDWSETGLIVRLELPIDRSVSHSPSSSQNAREEAAVEVSRDRDPQAA
jgi:two-component sensor histidine kinase